MMRNILAVFAGLVVGSFLNMGIIQLNTLVLFPAPEGMDMSDTEQLAAHIATLPAAAFVVVIAAHLTQAFAGGWVAARLAASQPRRLAMVVGALSLVGGVAAFFMFESPTWMLVELPLYLAVAWAAGTLEVARRARRPAGSAE